MIRAWEDARPRPSNGLLLALLSAAAIAAVCALVMVALGPLKATAAIVGLLGGVAMLLSPLFSLMTIVGMLTALWPYQLAKVAGVAGVASTLIWLFAQRRPLFVRDRLFTLTLAFTGLALLSGLTAVSRDGEYLRGIGSFASYVAMFWMMLALLNDERSTRWVVGVFVFSNVAHALIGLAQYKLQFLWVVSQVRALVESGVSIDVLIHQGYRGVFRIDGLTGTPDLLAMNMLATLPFAAVAAWRAPSPTRRIAWLGAFLLMMVAMFMTYSRATMVALAAMSLVVVIKVGLRRASPLLLAGALALLIVLAAWPSMRARVVSIIPFGGDKVEAETGQLEAAAWRWRSYSVGLEMMRDHALRPAGLDQQPKLWRIYAPELVWEGTEWTTPLHNTYMLAVVELGIWGGALYLVILVTTWRTLRAARRLLLAAGRAEPAGYALAAEIALVAIFVANQFYPLIEFRYVWFFVALAAVLHRLALTHARNPVPTPATRDR